MPASYQRWGKSGEAPKTVLKSGIPAFARMAAYGRKANFHMVNKTVWVMLFCLIALAGIAADRSGISESKLRDEISSLEQTAQELEEQNQGLGRMLSALDSGEIYIVVDTENNRLTLRTEDAVMRVAVCGTGSRQFVEEETGRNWFFETPLGSFTVLGKERNPVWIRPDWSFVEENMPVPPKGHPDRIVRGVLGKYALLLGSGYKIHGTTFTNLLGTHFTHGCVSLGDRDLEAVYKAVKIGTKVYIY